MLPSPRENITLSQRRIHSPSLPDLWVPAGNRLGPSPYLPPSPARAALASTLDIASPPTTNKSPLPLPLTPPLTPASIRPTESEPRSSRSNSIDISHFDPYAHGFSPVSQWSTDDLHSMPNHTSAGSSDSDHLHHTSVSAASIQDPSLLPSPTSPTRPRHSPAPPRIRDLESEFESQPASRFLFISGIPNAANSQALRQAFVACGDLKGIFVRFQAEHGAIILAFFDIRHTIRAHRQINTRTFFDNIRLVARFISADELRSLIGQSNFVNQNDGDLFISTSFVGPEGELDATALQNVLASFGDLRSFGPSDTHARAFHVEYFDARDALSALSALSGRVILGVRLHLALRDSDSGGGVGDEQVPFPRYAPPSPTMDPTVPQAPAGGIPFPHKTPPALERRSSIDDSLLHGTRHLSLHHSISEQDLRALARPSSDLPVHHHSLAPGYAPQEPESPAHAPAPEHAYHPRVKTPPQHIHARRISNIYHFDSVGKMPLPPTPPRPRSISVSSDTESPVAGRLALPPSPGGGAGRLVLDTNVGVGAEREVYAGPMSAPLLRSGVRIEPWARETDVAPPHASSAYAPEQYFMAPRRQQTLQLQMPAGPSRRHLTHGSKHAHALGLGLGLEMGTTAGDRDAPPERNRIDIARIERGDDTRTTVMIKNIPNKMSDRHLIEFINEVCPRKIDFLYLRMDFTNGCNVGYAFVNFIHVEDLLHFAKTKLGTKWNLFSSEKVLGMSYANYQGKEALIDKFRSSSIMDQREAWRPKLFHSSGSKQGLPEDFPAPTHMRRKERSTLLPNELHQHPHPHQSRSLFHHQQSDTRG